MKISLIVRYQNRNGRLLNERAVFLRQRIYRFDVGILRRPIDFADDLRAPGAHNWSFRLATPGCNGHAHCSDHRRERSEEHTSELQSLTNLVCRLLLEKK